MSSSDRTWQALEIVCPNDLSLDTHEQPPHDALARVVYQALWDDDCGPLTFLSLPGIQRQRTLLRAGSSPQTPPHQNSACDTNTATAAAERLASLGRREMPAGVGLGIVEVDTTPLGQATARTYRLLVRSHPTANRLQTTPPLLESVITALTSQPHALSVGFHRGPSKTTEISVRLVAFEPTAQKETRDGFAAAQKAPSVAASALTEAFEQSGYTASTQWAIPEHTGWSLQTPPKATPQETPLWRKDHAHARGDSQASIGMTLAMAPHEYRVVFDRSPADPLADHYDSVGLCSRLQPGVDSLSAFLPLNARSYERSVWGRIPGRTTARITPVAPIAVPRGLSVAQTDPTAEGRRQTAAELDGTYTPFERAVWRWCCQRKSRLNAVESSIEGVEFCRTDPDGSRRLVLCLEDSLPTASTNTPCDLLATPTTTSSVQPGDLVAASRLAITDHQYDGLDVFCQTESIAEDAFDVVVAPVQAVSGTETQLYSASRPLRSGDTVGLRPLETPPAQWTITDDHSLECRLDHGDPRAACRYGDRLAGLLTQLPRARYDHRTETYTVRYPTDKRPREFETKADLLAGFRPLCRPARPATVGSLLDTTRVFSKTDGGLHFRPTRATASWDRPLIAKRTDEAAAAFLKQYTIADPDATLAVEDVVSEFGSFLRYQSEEPLGGSYATVFSEYARDGTIHGRAWRYK